MKTENEIGLMTIKQASEYLQIRAKTIYAWAEAGSIPHYKIGRLIRFKKSDIDSWIEGHRKEQDKGEIERSAREALRSVRKGNIRNPDILAKKIIDEVKRETYTSSNGKSDQIKASRKEVSDGTL